MHERWMRECLRLARRGAGFVSPNPMVGCVIVKNGKAVGRGYHRRFGRSHAERAALKNAGSSVRGATLYVNLEPCSYYGKTPPCVDAILESGIRSVVIGTRDPNPLVFGKGIAALKKAGVRTQVGLLGKESRDLNESFFKYVRSGLPLVALKIAQTLDGKIASQAGQGGWITSREARRFGHQLRSQYDAVLVGAGTILADNPRLTVRLVRGRNPIRVVIDGRLRSPSGSKVFRNARTTPTLLFVSDRAARLNPRRVANLRRLEVDVIPLPAVRGRMSLRGILRELAKRNIASVLVEGGQRVYTDFIRSRLADKAFVFTAPKILGDGISSVGSLGRSGIARSGHLLRCSLQKVGSDTLLIGYFS